MCNWGLIYNSLVLLTYKFGHTCMRFKCENVTKLQKKVIRIVTVIKYNVHAEPLFKNAHTA